ncbi:MAG: CvpA family protein [Rhizobiaceae bacterium]|nr:CvpA family protein [Rhizobiaceae bacterium]
MSITLLDGILVVIMLISAILAMIRGFSREVLSIVSWIAAAFAAATFYSMFSPTIASTIPSVASNPLVADAISAASIFLVVLIVVSYVTMLLADLIIDSRIGVLDRTLGFIFGAARGALLVIITLMGFLWLANENEPEWVANAKSKPMLVAIGTNIRDALPENLEEVIKRFFENDGKDKKEGEEDTDQKT